MFFRPMDPMKKTGNRGGCFPSPKRRFFVTEPRVPTNDGIFFVGQGCTKLLDNNVKQIHGPTEAPVWVIPAGRKKNSLHDVDWNWKV